MALVSDPWLWAFLAMIGWFLGLLVVGSKAFGSHLPFGIVCITLAELPRIVLPLPFVDQPRFGAESELLLALGAVILIGSLVFGMPVFRIRPLTRPDKTEPLRTDGLYAFVRHPLMLCDTLWPLGWSLVWGSVLGVLLTPVWFGVSYLLTFLEEEKLLDQYGEEYARYRERVPRMVPSLRRGRSRERRNPTKR